MSNAKGQDFQTPDVGKMLAYQQAKERGNVPDTTFDQVLVNDEDETDQLRRENEKMRAELIEYQECGYVALEIENKTLRAENERLRGALEKIARGNKNEPMPDPSVIAKQALKEG